VRFKLDNYFKSIPNPFQAAFATDPERAFRKGKITKTTFIETMVHLVTGTNMSGAAIALMNVFAVTRNQLPVWASSFCRARQRVHLNWFKELFQSLLDHCHDEMATFDGLRVFAIDGQQIQLQRTADIVERGYNGRRVGNYKETYLPRGFLVAAYDVINGVCAGVTFNPTLNEPADARHLLKSLPTKSLFIYDRLYFSKKMIQAHIAHGSHFLFRCRVNAKKEIMEFFNLKKLKASFDYEGKTIYLIRIKHPQTGKQSIFATDLPEELRKPSVISSLYRSRWEVELFFRDSTATLRTEEWHSKTMNGNLQELYTAFWFMNLVRLAGNEACQNVLHPEECTYQKPNFKLYIQFIRQSFIDLWTKFYRVIGHLHSLSKSTTSTRTRYKRSYKRELKRPRSPYPHKKTGWDWGELAH
jgi:hypothetical protein